jgi:hypothetical protein
MSDPVLTSRPASFVAIGRASGRFRGFLRA